MLTLETVTTQAEWDARVTRFPQAHILQSWAWGEFKRRTTGWRPLRVAFLRDGQTVAVASIGVRQLGPLKLMYAPKGPILSDWGDSALVAEVLDALESLARRQQAIMLKIDPDVPVITGAPGDPDELVNPQGTALVSALVARRWRFSREQIQFRNTLVLDVTASEEALLAAMNQGTRRKLRTAQRDGVQVRAAVVPDDLDLLYRLYQETGARDDFLIRPQAYYRQAWQDFMAQGLAHALIAEVDGEQVAHVILYRYGQTAWYFYGASRDLHRDKMPNYLLQWEAIRWAKAQGCTRYDLWGAPDTFDDSDRMWGVYQFKRGFRPQVLQTPGAYDYTPTPWLYGLYAEALPRLRTVLRRLKG